VVRPGGAEGVRRLADQLHQVRVLQPRRCLHLGGVQAGEQQQVVEEYAHPGGLGAQPGQVFLPFLGFVGRRRGAFQVRLPGRGLDPCAMVKGWSVQWAAELLAARGARRFCLNAGGDVVAYGGPWRVGVRHPEQADRLCAVLEITDGAVATSARYERGDHILDGRSGRPATELLSVSVVAPSLTEADATTTAAFAMGAEGIEWAAAREGCEVFAVDAGHRVFRTEGFPVSR
jgi:thiamine biosynthesis lipoprotein ApbE